MQYQNQVYMKLLSYLMQTKKSKCMDLKDMVIIMIQDFQMIIITILMNKIFSVTGTHKPSDWVTNAYLSVGKLKDTSRYQESDKALKEAKAHYNPKSSITGHSQGGATASTIR